METGSPGRPTDYSSPGPELEGFVIARRPFLGFGLLISSFISALAVLIYLGAWASADRIEDRALAAGVAESHVKSEWWEDGLLFVCPFH